MAKYSYEFKKKVVMSYLKGEGGYGYIAKMYGIPAQKRVKEWVHNYNAFGDKGLKRSPLRFNIINCQYSQRPKMWEDHRVK